MGFISSSLTATAGKASPGLIGAYEVTATAALWAAEAIEETTDAIWEILCRKGGSW